MVAHHGVLETVGPVGMVGQTLSHLPENGEVQLPVMVADMLDRGRAQVRVLSSGEKWFGVTYREDKPFGERPPGPQ